MWKHFAINSYTSKCPPPVSLNTSAATQDLIYKCVLVVPLNPHDLQYCRPCFFYVLQIPFLDCQLSNYHQMVQMLLLLTIYISFTCSCLVLFSWPPLLCLLQRWLYNKGCVTLWPCQFTLKRYLKAKQELWKLKYFTMQKL